MKKLLLFLVTSCSLIANNQKVYVHRVNYAKAVVDAFEELKIDYEFVDTLDQSDDLYVISDIGSVEESKLPKYYIVYQSNDLTKNNITENFLNKLSRAIAVWDNSQHNINLYRSRIHNYYYFPENYEFIDPVCLSCTLPIEELRAYRELLMYSNTMNTDISSHLPTLFYYTISQNPKIIVEAGVRGGESTIPFRRAQVFCGAKLIGLDISSDSISVYSGISDSVFLCMDDLHFPEYWKSSNQNQNIDMVFIDTSHLYKHTLAEIKAFVPLLSENGALLFHDSNVTPINGVSWERINNTTGYAGPGNTRGVTQALKEYLGINFDEYRYLNFHQRSLDGILWHMIHYPFCNGLTILKKEKVLEK